MSDFASASSDSRQPIHIEDIRYCHFYCVRLVLLSSSYAIPDDVLSLHPPHIYSGPLELLLLLVYGLVLHFVRRQALSVAVLAHVLSTAFLLGVLGHYIEMVSHLSSSHILSHKIQQIFPLIHLHPSFPNLTIDLKPFSQQWLGLDGRREMLSPDEIAGNLGTSLVIAVITLSTIAVQLHKDQMLLRGPLAQHHRFIFFASAVAIHLAVGKSKDLLLRLSSLLKEQFCTSI